VAPDSSPNSPSTALDDLEPLGRALLDLSLKRGMSDAEIADVLGTDADAVLESRVELMRTIANEVAPESNGADVPALEAIVAEHLYGVSDGPELQPPKPIPPREPRAKPAPKRRTPLLVLLPLLLLGALIGIVIGLANTGDDDNPPPPSPPRPAEAKPISLASLAGHRERGSATVDGHKLHLRVSGLPKGAYAVWLYNSIADARRIGELTPPAGTLDVSLPPNWRDYRNVDVSLEPPDGNPNHSGQSVLRVPTDRLAR
jgi:hypothetical protein